MSFIGSDYVNLTAVSQFDTPIYMPKDGKPSTEAYNLGIYQRIANSLLWLKGQVDNAVKKTGNHTMTGRLSIPEPLLDEHAATKKYVDDTLGGISGTPGDPGGPPWVSGVGLDSFGYVKHLNGQMECWLYTGFSNTEGVKTLTFPAEFTAIHDVQCCVQLETPGIAGDWIAQVLTCGLTTCDVYQQAGSAASIGARIRVRVWGTY